MKISVYLNLSACVAIASGCDAPAASECVECVTQAEMNQLRADMEAAVNSLRDTTMNSDTVNLEPLDERISEIESRMADPLGLGGPLVTLIETNRTITVGTVENLTSVLADLDHYRIASTANVTIEVATGTYDFHQTVKFAHPDGARLRVVGAPAGVTWNFFGVDGIEVAGGASLGYLDGITIVGDGTTQDTVGVYVHDGAVMECGPAVSVKRFGGDGFVAERGGVLLAASTESAENAHTGYSAITGAVLYVPSANAHDNVGEGFSSLYGSTVYATDGVATSNDDDGFGVHSSGLVATDATATENGLSGFHPVYGSWLTAQGATASSNNSYGVDLYASVAFLDGATVEGNTYDGVSSRLGSFARVTNAVVRENGECGLYTSSGSSASQSGTSYDDNGCTYSPSPLSEGSEGSNNY